LVIGEQRVDKRTLAASEFYNDWLRPQSLFTTAGTILLKRGDVLTSLAVIRSRRPGSFDQEELAVWSKLMPHVQRAVQVHRELFSVRSHRDGALEALQGLRTAVLLAADDSQLLFCNDIADQILSAGSGISVRNGRLVASSPAATASLQAAIKNAATMDAGIADGSGGLVALPNGEHERLVVLVCPFKPGHELLPFCSPTALVLISARRCLPRILASDLMRLYGLTMAEARLACGLVQGFDPDEYSRQAGTSVATARTQLKQVFLKTGVHSQPALMRLILTNRLLRIHSAQD
jgi:DNA-binding CsgD family transcriptional regulator